ncbi:MAG: hypothetical protein NVSMB19_00600 [Vulcanimicrobiaceae bacterium]
MFQNERDVVVIASMRALFFAATLALAACSGGASIGAGSGGAPPGMAPGPASGPTATATASPGMPGAPAPGPSGSGAPASAPTATASPSGAPATPSPLATTASGALKATSTGSFTDAQGTFAYSVFAPPNPSGTSRPLVLALHGCLENPDNFEDGTRWFEDAVKNNYVVVMPQHPIGTGTDINPNGCYKYWDNHYRGKGEPEVLVGLVRAVAATDRIDAGRIYVAGMSSGAAMATALGADYPDVFAAVAAHSGTEYQPCVTDNVFECFVDLTTKNASQNPALSGRAAYGQSGARIAPEILIHGDVDTVVDPYNLDYAVRSIATMYDGIASRGTFPGTITSAPQKQDTGAVAGGYAYDHFVAANGNLEWYVVHGMNHSWSGGVNEPASNASNGNNYNDPKGPPATTIFRTFLFARRIGGG